VLGGLADNEQFALERVLVGGLLAARDEHLAYYGFDRLHALAQALVVHRHVAPAQQGLAFGFDLCFNDLFAGGAGFRIARQEQHADAVVSGSGQCDFILEECFAQEGVGDLDQDTGTIARQRIGPDRTAVREVFQDLQPLTDPIVTFLTFNMCDESDTACIMFMARIV